MQSYIQGPEAKENGETIYVGSVRQSKDGGGRIALLIVGGMVRGSGGGTGGGKKLPLRRSLSIKRGFYLHGFVQRREKKNNGAKRGGGGGATKSHDQVLKEENEKGESIEEKKTGEGG